MEQKALREWEAKCVQENPPGCTAGCPVHVDVRGMIAAVRNHDYSAGFALFRRMVPFPSIISRICDQPCQNSCQRNAIDAPIAVRALERVCMENNEKNAPPVVAPPLKNLKVAVVGAGLSGLTAALELSRKGYKVVVYESTNRRGGSIWDIHENVLPRTLIASDLSIFDRLPVEFRYGTFIGSNGFPALFDLCEEYDAVYLGVGLQGVGPFLDALTDNSGNQCIDSLTLALHWPKLFAGGSLRRQVQERSPIFSISDGKAAAVSIDRLLQQASLSANREKEGPFASSLYTNLDGILPEPQTLMADPSEGFSKEEAAREAARCILCECRECAKVCEFMTHYRSYPKRLVREVYNNASIVMGIHHANKMINSCSLCGLCREICPNRLDMAEVYHEARQLMVKKGKMPPSAHEFALRDMEFSNSDAFTLLRHQPGHKMSRVVFYPGCQLAGSAPHHVKTVYELLCSKLSGGVGLWLNCCGAPAEWAGQQELFNQTLKSLKEGWVQLGRPQVITACPTCFSMFRYGLQDIPVENAWTILNQFGLPDSCCKAPGKKLAIHDSCTTRNEQQLQQSVRNIARKLGYELEELPLSHEHTVCCGYGGLMIFANREIANKVINRRINESETEYLAYCSMCRDNFASRGKRALHILDLLFSKEIDQMAQRQSPGYSDRQENRARLKRTLLRDLWGENVEEPQPEISIIIPDSVRPVMEERMILLDDIRNVIKHAERTGSKFQSLDTGRYVAYYKPVSVTYWVEYSKQDDKYIVHNTYSHRIEISG